MTGDKSVPCWFFCGTDVYQSEEFIASIQTALYDGRPPDFPVERFYLDETSWPDILDSARTSPMLFSPGRVIVVKAPEAGDKNREKEGEKAAGRKGFVELASEDEALLSAYLASPPDRTILAVIAPGESKRARPLIKFFKSRPASQVRFHEFKPLRAPELRSWVAERARREGKAFDSDALDKFCELSSGDLRRMDGEIAKLAVYVGEKKTISLKDVGEIVPWVITLGDFDIQDALEEGDFGKCLAVLDATFSSTRATPEAILGKIGDFLGSVLQGKTLLAEGKTPKEVFSLLFPYIKETMGFFYRRKHDAFFSAVKSLGGYRLKALFQFLSEADLMVKRADIPPRVVLDAVFYRYCRMRKKGGVRKSS